MRASTKLSHLYYSRRNSGPVIRLEKTGEIWVEKFYLLDDIRLMGEIVGVR